MSRRATSFYYSFLALPQEKREAIIAVWDFCRAVDDAVDEAPRESHNNAGGEGALALAGWREELAGLYEGRDPRTSEGRSLRPCIQRFNLPRAAFEDLIDGVAMDLGTRRYETFEALRQYCLRVASAVGLICVEIFGYQDARTRDYAIDLGIALQLTNIVRDVAVDLEQGRMYLPLEDLARFGCREDDLRAGVVTSPVRSLLAFQCERARQYYRKAEETLPTVDARGLVAAQIMAAVYLALLKAIERANYNVFRGRIRVRRSRQALVAALTWLKVTVLSK
jgi:15-cis-phytoene synthase